MPTRNWLILCLWYSHVDKRDILLSSRVSVDQSWSHGRNYLNELLQGNPRQRDKVYQAYFVKTCGIWITTSLPAPEFRVFLYISKDWPKRGKLPPSTSRPRIADYSRPIAVKTTRTNLPLPLQRCRHSHSLKVATDGNTPTCDYCRQCSAQWGLHNRI
jgi:hypothetical protein